MTKEEKIDILWDMMLLNFRDNFNRKGICVGLCTIYQFVTDFRLHDMRDSIPELIQYRVTTNRHLYWWPYRGRFIPWWERHKAIWKTIRHLKKS
jgi:hypothetical protein